MSLLTKREKEIFTLLLKTKTTKEIATLKLTTPTLNLSLHLNVKPHTT